MNYGDWRTILIKIRALADQQVGYLEGVRGKLPLSPGGSDELAQCIDINRRIYREASNAESEIPVVHEIPREEARMAVGTDPI